MSLRNAIHVILGVVFCAVVFSGNGFAFAADSRSGICDTRADYYLGSEDYPQAAKYHRTLIVTHPGNALAHYHLGFAYGMMGRRADELAEYRAAAMLGLPDWDLYLNLGRAYLEQGNLDAAMDALKTAVALGPNHSEAHFNLGLAYERRGILDLARREVETSLRLDPNQPDALNMLGLIYAENRDYNHARRIWSELALADPGFKPARINLAILSLANGGSFETSGIGPHIFDTLSNVSSH